jgi:hypothetical protein
MNTQINNHQLVTFNVPHHLLNNFDELRKFKRVSRTSMILNLMEGFVRDEFKQIKDDDNLNTFIRDVKLRSSNPSTPSFNRQQSQKMKGWESSYLDEELPPSPIFNDQNDWRDGVGW